MILKEYKVEIKRTPNKNVLVNNLNQIANVLFFDMNSYPVNNAEYIVNEIEEREKTQGYNVLVFYKIISALVNILTDYEIRNNMFPCLREFFSHFRANYTDGEIRRKEIIDISQAYRKVREPIITIESTMKDKTKKELKELAKNM